MNQEYDEWEQYTGRLIVSFGYIELIVSKLFEMWQPEVSVSDYTLSQRLDRLIGHVSRLNDRDEKRIKIRESLIRVKVLSDIRNQVAHNPTVLQKFNETSFENVITDLRGESVPINIEQLHEFSDEAMYIASDLFILVSQYTDRAINELIT